MKKIIFNNENIIKKYGHGTESDIYYYKVNNDIVFLKLFKREIYLGNEIKIVTDKDIENKKNKLEFIEESPIFKNEIKLYDLVYDEKDNLLGYTMKVESLKTAHDINSIRKRIEILKLMREKIEFFNEHNIYIGDFNQSNILVTKDGIKLCDLDNIKIENYDFDLPGIFVLTYLNKFNDKSMIDNYSFNLETICYLGKIYEPFLLHNIYKNGLPRKINTKKNRILLKNVLQNKNYNKEYFIDDIRKFL